MMPMRPGPLVALGRHYTGDINRRMGLLHRPWCDGVLLVLEELALVREHVLLPGLDNHLQAFIKARSALPHIHPGEIVIVLVQPSSHPKIEPSSTEYIYHTVILKQTDGVVQWQEGHCRAQAYACGQACC